jgi:Alpha-glutamyl/putrescinyl thymine pyrophosphorylase clade 2
MTNYLFRRFEHNKEQKLWIAWLYGTTYYLPTTWVIWNEFPDMELVGVDRLTKWNNENYKRLRYQTDTKWNKGHLPAQFVSYKNWVGNRSQREAFAPFVDSSPQENFDRLWLEVKSKFHKFGRYSTWFYLQTLKQCCDMPIEPSNLMLNDHDGSRSHRNGLCMAVGEDDWYDQKLTGKQLEYLDEQANYILKQVREEFPNTDYFDMETCLCSFKKLFRTKHGRYLGYYIDRQAEEIAQCEKDGWFGIDWQPLWDSRVETLQKKLLTNKIDNSKMSLYLENEILDATGLFEHKPIGLEFFLE